MQPLYQTTTGGPDAKPHERGDSFEACLASVLEASISEVPRLCSLTPENLPPGAVYRALAEWLAPRGLSPVQLTVCGEWVDTISTVLGFYVLTGGSPRDGGTHSVVMCGNALVHDPHPDMHPSKLGDAPRFLAEPSEERPWVATFLAPFNPVKGYVRPHRRPLPIRAPGKVS